MHAERDHLNRVVFPELRSRCARRGADFVGIDLRWGLTEADTQQRGTLDACLKEIDRCRPFFVSLLGDRYGTVLALERIPVRLMEQVRSRPLDSVSVRLLEYYRLDDTLKTPVYRLRCDLDIRPERAAQLVRFWELSGFEKAGQSITEAEIFHGALNPPGHEPYAFFYLREPPLDSTPRFPKCLVPLFVDRDGPECKRLKNLKQRIDDARGANLVVRRYKAAYEGLRIDPLMLPSPSEEELTFLKRLGNHAVLQVDQLQQLSGISQDRLTSAAVVALGGLDELGRMVADDLWGAIEKHLDQALTTVDLHTEERLHHERFIARTTSTFIGREDLLERMLAYVGDPNERKLLFVTGQSGSGKSTLMAECVRRCRQRFPEAVVLPLFVGTAPGSTDLATMVRSLCESLRREGNVDDETSADPDKVQIQLKTFLAKAAANGMIVLLIDALNQLDPASRSHELNWLPFYVPQGARVIVSTLEGACLNVLRRRLPADRQLEVQPLRKAERENLVRNQLGFRSKRLTDVQMNGLVDNQKLADVGMPLYLQVAVEELSLCRDREALNHRLNDLPPTIDELFDQVLQRLEQDHTASATERTLSCIAVSRSGLLESEIIDLLSATDLDSPHLRWSQLYRALEFYLRPMDETNRSGLVGFFHDQLRTTVYRRYLDMQSPGAAESPSLQTVHHELARYFKTATTRSGSCGWRADRPHGLSELPYHLVHAGLPEQARTLVFDFEWLQAKLHALDPAALLADYDLFAGDQVLGPIEKTIRRAAQALARDKGQLAGQLLGRLRSYSAPEIRTLLKKADGWKDQPWLRPITASLARPDRPRTERLVGVSAVAVSPDLKYAITCSDEGSVKVWDIETEKEIRTVGGYTIVKCAAAATPDGSRVITSEDCTLRVWSPLETDQPLHILRGHTAQVTAVAITPDGRWAISASEDQSLRLWDVHRGMELPRFEGQLLSANLLAITPDARRGISASFDGSLRFWNTEAGSELRPLVHHGRAIKALAISTDGTCAIFSSDNDLHVFDIERDRDTKLAGHHGVIRTVAAASTGLVVSGSDDINLRVWDVQRCCEIGILIEHGWSVTAASVTPNGHYAVSAARDETVKLWDLRTLQELRTLRVPSQWINSVVATPDGNHVVTASRDAMIKVWDVESGALLRTFSGHTAWANTVAITPDGSTVLSGGDDNVVRVWSLADGLAIATLEGYKNGVSALAISPDGRRAISGCWDQTLKIWDLENYTKIRDLPGHLNEEQPGWIRAVAITPDGLRAVSASQDHTLKVWDLETGAEIRTLAGHTEWVMSVAIFPDGKYVISGSADNTLKVWELETGTVIRTLEGHHGFVTAVALLPGAQLAVSASEDFTLRVWDLASGKTLMSFTADGELRACAVSPASNTIVAAEDSGRLHFLRIVSNPMLDCR